MVEFPAGTRGLSIFYSVQTCSGAHPFSNLECKVLLSWGSMCPEREDEQVMNGVYLCTLLALLAMTGTILLLLCSVPKNYNKNWRLTFKVENQMCPQEERAMKKNASGSITTCLCEADPDPCG
jgi:hypothetical protein